MKRNVKAAVCSAAAGLLLTAGIANAAADTEVTLKLDDRGRSEYFVGRVNSPRPRCEEERRVVVHYFPASGRGFYIVGRDKTSDRGRFQVRWPIGETDPGTGTYRATARATDNCERGVATYEHQGRY